MNNIYWDPREPSPSPEEIYEGLRRVAPAIYFECSGATGLYGSVPAPKTYLVVHGRAVCISEGLFISVNADFGNILDFKEKDPDYAGHLIPTPIALAFAMGDRLAGKAPAKQARRAQLYLIRAKRQRNRAPFPLTR